MDLQLFTFLTKYPFIYEMDFFDSQELKQNTTCIKKCKEKDCLKQFGKASHLTEYICSKGYNNTFIQVAESKILFNGLLFNTNKDVSRDIRLAKKEWIIDKKDLQIFVTKILEINKYLISSSNDATEKNFSMFHDFKTSMNIIFSCTQNIIDNLPGETFETKLRNSDRIYQSLYNSLQLISSQLGMMDVIINPKSIVFGNKRMINIFKLFDKARILFGYHSATKKNISIELKSIGNKNIFDSYCYDSIEFIPLILLDNALKYSAQDSTINIEINQLYNKVVVSVENIGPFVHDDNKEKIFEKFVRDESGVSFAKDGIGMGLWIAREIMHAHDTEIKYFKDINEIRPIGLNIFRFELATNI